MFQDYLENCVKYSSLPLPLEYQSDTPEGPKIKVFAPKHIESSSTAKDFVIFKPTTPLFYTKLALSNHTSKFISSIVHCSDPLISIFHTNHPDLLQTLFSKGDTQKFLFDRVLSSTQLRWLPSSLLRGFRTSHLDRYAMAHANSAKANEYRKAVTKLLVARYCVFGFVEVLDFILWCVRTWLLWQCLEGSVELLMRDGKYQPMSQTFGNYSIKVWGYHLWCIAGKIF